MSSAATSALGAALLLLLTLNMTLPFSTARARPSGLIRGQVRTKMELRVRDGALVGEEVDGVGGAAKYYAFRGIPYAAPPTHNLRFKNPRPPSPWQGARDATREGARCAQVGVPSKQLEGQEDCLFLNVYTPSAAGQRGQPLLPVMVYLHGGGFQYGSGTAEENGPDFLVHHGVILVTVNYRLGAFGFLNLDNDDIPGNMGLKDQLAALQWVQDNIQDFGGDPHRVTLFGNSAGAASVHYHTIVPASKGLFGAAIMQSGNALANYAYQENHLQMAQRLGQLLGASGSDPQQVARAVRRASTLDILTATVKMVQEDPMLKLGYPAFGPSPERREGSPGGEAKFLSRDPESLVLQPQVSAVPTIAGITGEEGLFAYTFGGLKQSPATVSLLASNVSLLLPPNLRPYQDTAQVLHLEPADQAALAASQASRVQREYLAGKNITEDARPFITLLGDLFNVIPTHRLATLTKRSAESPPLYLYHFLKDGLYNWGKKSFNITDDGATHTDELGYLMHITSPKDLHQTLTGHSSSSKALQQLTTMWTNFAKTRQPLPKDQHGWPPATGCIEKASYAKISSSISTAQGLGGPRMTLWEELYAERRTPNPRTI